MNLRLHEVRYRLVDELVTAQRWQSHKPRAADRHVEMPAGACACVTGV